MSYLITFFSVIIGYLIALLIKPKSQKHLKLFLTFSGALLLSLTVMHLMPQVFVEDPHDHSHDHAHDGHSHFSGIGLIMMLGVLFQIILEFFSRGSEHGHVHHGESFEESTPWALFISLCLHAFFEGMPISNNNHFAFGIGIHHLPVAIILTTFFYKSGMRPMKIFIFMLIFALMTPLGIWFSDIQEWTKPYYRQITAFVIGILLHISSTIIFEDSQNHRFNFNKILAICSGIVLALGLELFHHH